MNKGLNMKPKLDAIVKLYRQWATSIPCPKSASLCVDPADDRRFLLQSFWQVRDLEQLEQSTFVKCHHIAKKNAAENKIDFTQIGFPSELGSEGLTSVSPSGQFRAVIRKVTDKKGQRKQILEVWSKHSKTTTIDLTLQDVHGDVCEDGQFGSLQWSSNERRLLYIAEKKFPKSEHFFSQKNLSNNDKKEDSPTKTPATEQGIGQYRQEWGEQLVGRIHPVPFVLELETLKILALEEIPDNLSCGQAIWGPNDTSVVFVGWDEEPKKLGLVFCPIRKNSLCEYHLEDKKFSCIYDLKGWCVRSPKLSPDQKTLLYLDNPVGGPHISCCRLSKYNWSTDQHFVVVDIVQMPSINGFPGIYCEKLPKKCFTSDGRHIVLPSFWKSKQELLAVNIETCEVRRLTNDPKIGCWSLLDLYNDWIVAARSAPNTKPHLVLGKLTSLDGIQLEVKDWHSVESEEELILDGLEWEILTLKLQDAPEEMSFEAIVCKPSDRISKIPVVFIPHGGPHSTMSPQFYLSVFLFNKLGFGVVLVNFRGSLGFGQRSLESLLTTVGVQEVQEMVLATRAVTEQGWADSTKFAVSGGSFGGYLLAQLVGQHPDLFRCCVCRNPVVDICSNADASDIPEWSWVTSGLGDSYNHTAMLTPEVRKIFWEKSPFQYLPAVTADFLMLLSKNDLRVPPFQGINYYNQLKAIGKAKTKMYMYEDNHGQAKVDVESDAFIRATLWMLDSFYPE